MAPLVLFAIFASGLRLTQDLHLVKPDIKQCLAPSERSDPPSRRILPIILVLQEIRFLQEIRLMIGEDMSIQNKCWPK
jgi:hypothetical protein